MRFADWLRQLSLDSLIEFAIMAVAILLCLTIHEMCHGLTAYLLGDPTAKRAGRLSLNPIRHIDLAGLIMIAIVHFGWAKPVPVDPRHFKDPKAGMAMTALAGPLSNVILSFVALTLYYAALYFHFRSDGASGWYYAAYLFYYIAALSAGLAVFNLIPIPPLDGSKVLFSFLPDRAYATFLRYERYGMFLLIVLLFANVLDTPLIYMRDTLLDGLRFVCDWPFRLLARLSL